MSPNVSARSRYRFLTVWNWNFPKVNFYSRKKLFCLWEPDFSECFSGAVQGFQRGKKYIVYGVKRTPVDLLPQTPYETPFIQNPAMVQFWSQIPSKKSRCDAFCFIRNTFSSYVIWTSLKIYGLSFFNTSRKRRKNAIILSFFFFQRRIVCQSGWRTHSWQIHHWEVGDQLVAIQKWNFIKWCFF